jgi:putative DNA primase/helicase
MQQNFLHLASLARALGGEVSNGQVLCPGPGHKSASDRSLSVKPDPGAPDGFLVHSFAGDDPILCRDHVRQKCGLPAFKPNGGNSRQRATRAELEALFRGAAAEHRGEGKKLTVVAKYHYTDEKGVLHYQVLRLEPKSFRQRRPNGKGGWIWNLKDTPRVVYRWPELLEYPDATVFVTEGEKDCDRVRSLKLCATCVAHGKWTEDCTVALAGRDVVILQDADDPGHAKALAAATALNGKANTIRIVKLPGLTGHPNNKDVSDWLDADPSRAGKLADVCLEAPLWEPSEPIGSPPVEKSDTPLDVDSPGVEGEIITCRVADITPRPIDWLWQPRLARGKITLIAGDPGLGKSQIGIDLHARLSSGNYWPDGTRAPRANSIILSAEDAASDTLRPRLEAADADLNRVWILDAVRTKDGKRSFCLQQDLDQLGAAMERIGNVAMITIDPITSYMGKIDSHRTVDVRGVLEPLAAFAEQHHVAVLAVSHPPKASQAKAIHAVTGSLAFVAAARIVFVVVEEPETGRRLLLPTKNNLAAMPLGLAYRLEQLHVSQDILASHVIWDCEPVTVSANEALAQDRESAKADDMVREAKDFLRHVLANGPRLAKEVTEEAKDAGIAAKTLERARRAIRVKASKDGFQGPWTWALA